MQVAHSLGRKREKNTPKIEKAAETEQDNARAGAAPPLPRQGEPDCEHPRTVAARPRYRATAGPQPKAARPPNVPAERAGLQGSPSLGRASGDVRGR